MTVIWVCLAFALIIAIINGANYICLTPTPFVIPAPAHRQSKRAAQWLHRAAYLLSLLRLPFIFIPYLAKSCLYLVLGDTFAPWWKRRSIQALRVIGDFANFALTTLFLQASSASAPDWITLCVNAAITAEAIRLILEKGQMLISVLWQSLPHRHLAAWLQTAPLKQRLHAYSTYYHLDNEARFNYIIELIRQWSCTDPATYARLRYVNAFRVVEASFDLRSGQVRNVACGEIYVHASWSNDPWLLIGQAMRRSPWLFDPRHLQRPFFYRTQANPLATRFVLEYAHYSPPFALYQFGHEIKVARFEIFYRACRALGFQLEALVQADGTYQFDPALIWLGTHLRRSIPPASNPIPSEADVLKLLTQTSNANHSAEAIASTYSLPLAYVEEVLLPILSQAEVRTADTVSGTSQ